MKKVILLFSISILLCLGSFGQNTIGTPYSMYGIGLLQDNYGPYTALGGVSAAMRDNYNINFLNPASYTALDSNRFHVQLGVTGEFVNISTHKESNNYRVAQNAALNMGLRLFKNMYASFGFTQRSNIGYNLHYFKAINGSDNEYYNQEINGKGGLNDFYFGLAYKIKNLSIGLNTSVIFGNLERRLTLVPIVTDSYYINTQTKTSITDVVFNVGLQYDFKLSALSKLTAGSSFNFGSDLNAKKTFVAYKVNTSSQGQETIDNEVLKNGNISYPFRVIGGLAYDYKDKWMVVGDYTYQKMSAYKEFGVEQDYNDYHKAAFGISLLPARFGRYWWQRNKYMLGGYAVRSQIELNNININTYALTFGIQMPMYIPNRELMLGIAFDLGVRGTEKNGLIQEKFGKIRINIAFKEGWFMKRKIE